jgi:hypothetical protein
MDFSKRQWHLLGIIYDTWEPFEQVYLHLAHLVEGTLPVQVRSDVFKLQASGYLRILQAPIKNLGQQFESREVHPATEEDVFGDLVDQFQLFSLERNYLQHASQYNIGVPLGIWLEITKCGKQEWDRERNRRKA